jgi:ribosome-binding factor A
MPREFSRTLRINAQLQRELSALIRGELTDPRVARVSVTQVSVAPDMRNARVAVSLLGSDAELAAAAKALNGAASLLRRALGKSLKLRYVPALSFVADEALREGDRIGSLIRDATARDRVQPALKDDEAGAPPPDDGKQ